MQSPNESDGSEEYFDAEDSTPHRLVKYVQNIKKNCNACKIVHCKMSTCERICIMLQLIDTSIVFT